MKRVSEKLVITGLGPVSPIGIGCEEFGPAFAGRESAIHPLVGLELPEGVAVPLCAQLVDFDLRDHLDSDKTYLDNVSAHLLAACALAKGQAKLEVTDDNKTRIGSCFGAAYGPLASAAMFQARVAAKGARLANPLIFGHTYINTAASLVAIEWGFIGFNCIVSSGLTSGAAAICQAADALHLGAADAMLCGGSDAISPALVVGLSAQGLLVSDAHPGMVLGEGAGVIVLETESSARARKARPVGRLDGYATASGSRPQEALDRACAEALAMAGLADSAIDVIVCCANGATTIDAAQSALRPSRFGRAHLLKPKTLQGETLAAAAGLDVALALLELGKDQTALILSADWCGSAAALVVGKSG